MGLGDLFLVFNIRFQMFIIFYSSQLQSSSLAQSIIPPEQQETQCFALCLHQLFSNTNLVRAPVPLCDVISGTVWFQHMFYE